jgi:streptogramin lyase
MITNRPLPQPAPTPLCATLARLLPLRHSHELTPDQIDAVDQHVVACAWCQSVLATYDVVDDALRRHFGPNSVAPSVFTMEAIWGATDQEDRRSASEDHDDVATVTGPRPSPATPSLLRRPNRYLSGLAALAAVLVVTLLAQLIFNALRPLAGRSSLIALPAVHTGRFTEYSLPTLITQPRGIAVGRDGNLWFTESNNGAIGRLSTKGVLREFPLPRSDCTPNGITLGLDGNIWFTESFGSRIGRITPTGKITEFSVPSAATIVSGLSGITAGPDGNIWFVEEYSNRIGRITPQGVITEFPLPTVGVDPDGIVAGPDGNLWFTERSGNQIGRITPKGHITEFPLRNPGSGPDGITKGPDGNIWFNEAEGNRIGRITPKGHISEFSSYSSASNATGQGSITTGPDGNLWFVAAEYDALGQITLHGVSTEFPLPGSHSIPDSIITGPDGALWFTENGGNRIGRFSP